MLEKLKIGDFGYFEFTIKKKRIVDGKERIYVTPFSGHYKVVDSDRLNVELSDGDKNLLVTRRRITVFEAKEEPKI